MVALLPYGSCQTSSWDLEISGVLHISIRLSIGSLWGNGIFKVLEGQVLKIWGLGCLKHLGVEEGVLSLTRTGESGVGQRGGGGGARGGDRD